jgi:hypothetical protein
MYRRDLNQLSHHCAPQLHNSRQQQSSWPGHTCCTLNCSCISSASEQADALAILHGTAIASAATIDINSLQEPAEAIPRQDWC